VTHKTSLTNQEEEKAEEEEEEEEEEDVDVLSETRIYKILHTLVLLLSIGIQILEIPICQKNSHVS
jgi:hypothetical protein